MALLFLGGAPTPPTVEWSDPTLSLIEGASGDLTLNVTTGSNPDGLDVHVSAVGGAELGMDYSVTWPGGTPLVVHIPSGQLTVDVPVAALVDIDPEGGETATLTIQPQPTYQVGTQAQTLLEITEPSTDPTAVEYSSTGIPGELVQVCIPIDPVPVGSLPAFALDAQEADAFPVAQTHDGLIDWVQVVGPAGGTGTAIVTVGDGAAKPAPAFDAVDLSTLKLEMVLEGGEVVECVLTSSEVEVERAGVFVDERHYFGLLQPSGRPEKVAVHTWVTRRSDLGVKLDILVANDVYDPGFDPGDSHFQFHAEVAGDVYFESIRMVGLPAGYELVASAEDPSMDASAGEVVKAELNRVHLLPGRARIARHYALVPTGNQAAADAINRFGGFGYAESGPYSVHARRGYGPNRMRVPKYGSSYTRLGALVGREASKQWANELRLAMEAAVTTGGTGAGFDTSQNGFHHPFGPPDPDNAGGTLLHLRWGTHFVDEEWFATLLQLDYTLQRHATGITDPNTGKSVTAQQLADTNGRAPGVFPFSMYHHKRWERWFPHFLDGSTAGVSSASNPITRKPNLRPWCNHTNPVAEIETVVQPFHSTQLWPPYEGAHHARYYQCLQPLIWGCNKGFAKWLMRQEACHLEMNFPGMPVAANSSEGHVVEAFNYNSEGFVRIREVLDEQGRRAAGGSFLSSDHNIQWYRGNAHSWSCMAEAARIEFDPARRGELSAWAVEMARTADWILSPLGIARRSFTTEGNQNHPDDPNVWGPTQLLGGGPPEPGRGAMPSNYTAVQYYMMSFLAWGFYAVEVALRPRVVDGSSPNPTEQIKYLRCVVDLCRSMWEAREAHPDDPALASGYCLCSTANVDFASDPPDTVMRPWVFAWIGGGNWPGHSDERNMTHLLVALRMSRDLGLTGSGDFKRWAKRQMGLDETATDAELIGAMEVRASNDVAPHDRPFHGYVVEMIGEIQADEGVI